MTDLPTATPGPDWGDGYVTERPYTAGFYRELSPMELTFALRWQGLVVPDIERPFHYFELGCGHGRTASLLGAAWPHAHFYANDFNPTHVVSARDFAASAGVSNVEYIEASFAELLEPRRLDALPPLDFIVLHGVYSWVSRENQRRILEFVRRKLRAGGVLLIDYNTDVGWASVRPMQRLVHTLASQGNGPADSRVIRALEQVDALSKADAQFFRAQPAAARWIERVQGYSHAYLVHEYLNDAWEPLSFADVVRDLSSIRLKFVASTDFLHHFDELVVPPESREAFAAFTDPVAREIAADLIANRSFRHDVFVRGPCERPPRDRLDALLDTRYGIARRRDLCSLEDIDVPAGSCTLPEERCIPILEALSRGPRTLRALRAETELGQLGEAEAVRLIGVLIAMRYVAPLRAIDPDSSVASRHNTAVLDGCVRHGGAGALASSRYGTGFEVDPFMSLIVAGDRAGVADVARYATDALQARGERLVKKDRPIEVPEEMLSEMREQTTAYLERERPMLVQFGVVPPETALTRAVR